MSGSGHVVLVGLPGSGKSTVGPLLAHLLGRPAIDTDADVERRLGRSVAAAFAELGEPRFRTEELVSLDAALASPRAAVISAGGGLIAQPGVGRDIARRATVVWLDADDPDLLERIGDAGGRPLLRDDPPARLAELRRARVAAHTAAHVRVDTSRLEPAQVARRVADVLRSSLRVNTDPAYLVTVAHGALGRLGDHLPAAAQRVALIADRAVAAVAETAAEQLRGGGRHVTVIGVDGGESLKRWAVAGSLIDACAETGLERDDCVVALGGGSVGDVAGFVAASYLRGVAWVVVPTTLLAMVDSAIGGKTAVNLERGKNLAGAFWQPRAVLCDPALLGTLPERSHRSAFAEIVKSSMVGGGSLAALVQSRLQQCLERQPEALAAVIRGCCALKAEIVGEDEREAGRRAILNYGHTVGHAVEALTGYGNEEAPDHGEAVAFGMRVAGELSLRVTGCPPADINAQNRLLDSCGLAWAGPVDVDALMGQLASDKKARGGLPRWVLLEGRGRPVSGVTVPEVVVREAITAVRGS